MSVLEANSLAFESIKHDKQHSAPFQL